MTTACQRDAILAMRRFPVYLLLLAAGWAIPAAAEETGLDGITIIDYAGRTSPLGDGVAYIVTFVSPHGSYGAAVPAGKGSHAGCFSLGRTDTGPGSSLGFGIDADIGVRQQGLDTICPNFTLRLESAATVRIEVSTERGLVSEQRNVMAHVPWRALDFALPHFAGHDVKGVRLGPIDGKELKPLPAKRAFASQPRSRGFEHRVGAGANILGKAAAGEITGWPSDILYFIQYLDQFEQKSSGESFKKAVLQRYGVPSSEYEESGYMLWLYDLDGAQVTLEPDPANSCRQTMEFWLKYDLIKRVHGLNWEFNSSDLGPWGCSLIMDLNPNRSDGGVSGYSVKVLSGYVMAVNHFSQRLDQVQDVMKKVEALQGFKPPL